MFTLPTDGWMRSLKLWNLMTRSEQNGWISLLLIAVVLGTAMGLSVVFLGADPVSAFTVTFFGTGATGGIILAEAENNERKL